MADQNCQTQQGQGAGGRAAGDDTSRTSGGDISGYTGSTGRPASGVDETRRRSGEDETGKPDSVRTMTGGQDSASGGQAGELGNRSGSGSGGQGESDMGDASGQATIG